MTVTRNEWAKDSRIPPKNNEAVAQIMAEKLEQEVIDLLKIMGVA